METYQRPTKIVELPSGKKVEIITYFSQMEIEDISSELIRGITISPERASELKDSGLSEEEMGRKAMEGQSLDPENIKKSNRLARKMAIKKLIDIDGIEYEATEENISEFLSQEDSIILTKEIDEMTKKK